MSTRKIPPNRRSITGHVPSRKKPGMLAFESQLERDLYTLLEFDPTVHTVREQPVQIPFVDSRGRLQHYTPDCLIEYVQDSSYYRWPMLAEVKYRTDLFRLWPEIHPKLRAAARYARQRCQTFRILTEREIHGPRLQNARWLLSYRAIPVPQSEVYAICEKLRSPRAPLTPMALLANMTDREPRREELLVAIWYAIANGHIAANLDEKLTMSSPIWVSARFESHLDSVTRLPNVISLHARRVSNLK